MQRSRTGSLREEEAGRERRKAYKCAATLPGEGPTDVALAYVGGVVAREHHVEISETELLLSFTSNDAKVKATGCAAGPGYEQFLYN